MTLSSLLRCTPRRISAALLAVLSAALSPLVACAQTVVPDPTRALSPDPAFILQVDAQAVAMSPVGKSLGSLFQDLPGQLGNLPGGPELPVDEALARSALKVFQELELGQLVVVAQGKPGVSDARDSLLAVAKLTQIVPDQETLINQVLDLADQEQPGIKDQLLNSRTREGAADLFNLPAGAFGTDSMPFPLSLAMGPGDGGTVLALGRTETLKSFLAGEPRVNFPRASSQSCPTAV